MLRKCRYSALIVLCTGCAGDPQPTRDVAGKGTEVGTSLHDSGTPPVSDASSELPESCFETPLGAEPLPEATGPLEVELGALDPLTGVDLLPLNDGCSIPIGGVGQAGLTARLALRFRTESEPSRDAYARVTLVNYLDREREPAPNNGPGVVRRWDCREDGWCYLAPLLVEISHLNRLPALEGTLVTFSAEVEAADDPSSVGSTHGWGRFVREDDL